MKHQQDRSGLNVATCSVRFAENPLYGIGDTQRKDDYVMQDLFVEAGKH